MTEIFYRLLSEANGELYQFEKEERLALAQSAVNKLLATEMMKNQIHILNSAKKLLANYDRLDLMLPITDVIEVQRRKLADDCLNMRKQIFKKIQKDVKGVSYKLISNERFSALKKSHITPYLFIAIYMHECRGRLLEFLLKN